MSQTTHNTTLPLLVDGQIRLFTLSLSLSLTQRPSVYLWPSTKGGNLGTEKDPYDASTEDKHDALMRSFPEHAIIHYLDGDFSTAGSPLLYNDDTRGFFAKTGWTVDGRGENRTRLLRTRYPTNTNGIGHALVANSMYSPGSISVSNMTIDGNWKALNADPDNCTCELSLAGNNNVIRNVRLIGGYGSEKREAFTLSIRPWHDGKSWQHCTGGLIDGCEVSGFTGNNGIGVLIMSGADETQGTVHGIIRNTTVIGYKGTAAFGLGSNVIHEGNRTIGCRRAVYMDTGFSDNCVIRNCKFMDTSAQAIYVTLAMGAKRLTNLLIEHCDIEINGEEEPAIGVALSKEDMGSIQNVTIYGNRFLRKATGAAKDIVAISAAGVDGLNVKDNVVDPDMRSQAIWPEYPSTKVVIGGNHTPAGVAPVGLEDAIV